MSCGWRRTASALGIGVFLVLFAASVIGQEARVDVIRRVEEVAGKGTWGVAGSFSSAGESWSGFDLWGVPYMAVQTVDSRGVTMAGSVCVDPRVRVGADLSVDRLRTSLRMESGGSVSEQRYSEQGMVFSTFVEFTGDSANLFDPRVRMTLASYGRSQENERSGTMFGIAGSASYILDPVVFAGTLDWGLSSKAPNQRLTASISVGLVANSRITMAVEASRSRAIACIAVPRSTMTMRTSIALEADRSKYLDLSVTLHPGDDARTMTIGVGVRGTAP